MPFILVENLERLSWFEETAKEVEEEFAWVLGLQRSSDDEYDSEMFLQPAALVLVTLGKE